LQPLGGLKQPFLNVPFLRVDLFKVNKASRHRLEFLSERCLGKEEPTAGRITRFSLGWC